MHQEKSKRTLERVLTNKSSFDLGSALLVSNMLLVLSGEKMGEEIAISFRRRSGKKRERERKRTS